MPKLDAQMDVPDEYLKEIGRISVCFSSLEFLLHSTLVFALLGRFDNDGRANAIVAEMGFDQKLNALESILRLADQSPVKATHPFRAIRPLLEQSRDKRNIVAHHMWTGNNGGVYKSDIQLRKGKLKVVLDMVTLQELTEMGVIISNARAALQGFSVARFFPTSDAPQ